MGKFSPYSEEWEKARIKKALDQMSAEYLHRKAAFEKLPRPIQAFIRAGQTVSYCCSIAWIGVRKAVNPRYRREMEAGVAEIKKMMETSIQSDSSQTGEK